VRCLTLLHCFESAGQLKTNSALRSRQLRGNIERLGPAYVKVAQALSTRVDILDANYLTQIELLQVCGCTTRES